MSPTAPPAAWWLCTKPVQEGPKCSHDTRAAVPQGALASPAAGAACFVRGALVQKGGVWAVVRWGVDRPQLTIFPQSWHQAAVMDGAEGSFCQGGASPKRGPSAGTAPHTGGEVQREVWGRGRHLLPHCEIISMYWSPPLVPETALLGGAGYQNHQAMIRSLELTGPPPILWKWGGAGNGVNN